MKPDVALLSGCNPPQIRPPCWDDVVGSANTSVVSLAWLRDFPEWHHQTNADLTVKMVSARYWSGDGVISGDISDGDFHLKDGLLGSCSL